MTTVDDILKLKPNIQKIFIEAGILKDDSEEEWNRYCTYYVIMTFLEKVREEQKKGKKRREEDEDSDTE